MAKKKSPIDNFTPEQKLHYEQLLAARDKVLGRLQTHAEEALDGSNSDKRGVTTHMADLGSDNSRHEMELQMMTDEGDVLELIDDALKRLISGNGEYGHCIDCGKAIPEARLNVRPYAIYCVQCKSVHEKNGTLPGRRR